MKKLLPMFVLAAFCGTASAQGVQEEDFYVQDAQDLVDLCEAPGTSEHAIAAVHFCHGYLVGAFQYYNESIKALGFAPFFCLPDPPPTRNDAIAGLMSWIKADPARGQMQAIDATFQYLGESYPCSE